MYLFYNKCVIIICKIELVNLNFCKLWEIMYILYKIGINLVYFILLLF